MHPNMSKYKPDWQEARERVFLDVSCQDEPMARNVLRELDRIGI